LDVLLALINILYFAVLGQVVLSWLLMAGMRNDLIFRLDYALGLITRPLMRPLRRVIPSIGVIDITPIVAIVILSVLRAVIASRSSVPL